MKNNERKAVSKSQVLKEKELEVAGVKVVKKGENPLSNALMYSCCRKTQRVKIC